VPEIATHGGGKPCIEPLSGQMIRVLVIDDEPNIRQTLALCLKQMGCEVAQAATADAALDALRQRAFDLALLDLRLGDEDGIEVLPTLMALRPDLDVVIITAYSSVGSAVEAMRRGARDYLPKPFTPAQIQRLVERTRERRELQQRVSHLEFQPQEATPEPRLETASARMRTALQMVARAATHDVPVLLRGEAGTGKGALARAVHEQSARRDRAFVVVSCPILPEERLIGELFGRAAHAAPQQPPAPGHLESADGGTVFLDEIGDLSPAAQARLLLFLQQKRFERVGETASRGADVRIVATTERDLESEVSAGRWRQDLLYRLNVMEIVVPPLRERVEDILPLAREFVAFFAKQARRPTPELSRAAESLLIGWKWPGNVRELRNAIERALILAPGDVIEPEVFPERMLQRPEGGPLPGGDFTADEVEREHVMRVLARIPTLAEASRVLGIDITTLWRKRKRWGR
jgi:two-component system, NtrC family, response regulator AlgB